MHLQVLDIEGSIEKLGFDPLDDTKVSALVLPTAIFLQMEWIRMHSEAAGCSAQGLLRGWYSGQC